MANKVIAYGFRIYRSDSSSGIWLKQFAPHPKTWSDGFHEPDRYTGWKLIPGKEGKFVKGRIESYVKVNSHGFRDKERTYEKKKGTFRILVLGDSITEGMQVSLEQTFSYILEERLNSEGSKNFEVINLGVAGFGTAQEYLTLKHYGLKYQPDFVVLSFFVGNDIKDNSFALKDLRPRPFFVLNNGKLEEIPFKIRGNNKITAEKRVAWTVPSLGFFDKVFPNVYHSLNDRINETPWLLDLLWNLGIIKSKPELIDKSKKNEIFEGHHLYAEKYPPEWQSAWEVTKALILRISKELKENNIGFLTIVIPNHANVRLGSDFQSKRIIKTIKLDYEKPERILSKFLKESRVNYLEFFPEFEKYFNNTGRRLNFWYKYDGHLNTDGHALVAELIHRKLKEDKLVPIEIENKQ